jgi:hypothetical protein
MKKLRRTRSLRITRDKLYKKEIILKKLCHEEGCKYYKDCPNECCDKSLGLHTAILWALSDTINNLSNCLSYERIEKFEMEECYTENRLLKWLSYQHQNFFSKKEYKELCLAANYTRSIEEYIGLRLAKGINRINQIFKE